MIEEANKLFVGVKTSESKIHWKYVIPTAILLFPPIIRWLVSILIRSNTVPSKQYLIIVFVTIGIQIQVAYMYFLFSCSNILWSYYEYLGDVYFICSLCLIAIIFGICEFAAYFNIYDNILKQKKTSEIEPTNVSLLPAIFSTLFSLMIIERIWTKNLK